MIGLLYDIHGNLPALTAVLADATDQGADSYLLGGDYALFGGWPAETVVRLRELDAVAWIRGNGERWTAHPGDAPEAVHEPIAAAVRGEHGARSGCADRHGNAPPPARHGRLRRLMSIQCRVAMPGSSVPFLCAKR